MLYYKNEERNGARIARDFVAKLFPAVSTNLKSDMFIQFLAYSRVPNERELYGLFVKSILEAFSEGIGHVATEFQVGRGDDSKGRVDLLVNYRSASILLELKLGRISAARGSSGSDNAIKQRATEIFYEAKNQLENLEISSVNNLMRKRPIKIPVAIYFYVSQNDMSNTVDHAKIHEQLHNALDPDFSYYSKLAPTWTRRRTTSLDDSVDMMLYGVSIVGSHLDPV